MRYYSRWSFITFKIIPRTQFLAAMSLMSLAGLLGPLAGPTLGGWLVEVATWRGSFFINIPMGVLGILMTLKVMPNVKSLPLKPLTLLGLYFWLLQ